MANSSDIKALADRQRRRGSGLVLAWVALMLGLCFPYFESTRNANERPRLLQAMALVEDGSWAIDGPAARSLDPGPDVSRSAFDQRLYPNKPPGTTLVAAAGYRLAVAAADEPGPTLRSFTWWARALGGLLPTVLLCGVLLRRYAAMFGPMAGATAVVLYALGTPAAAYAHLLYGHQLAAALLFAGVTLLVDATADRASSERGRGRTRGASALGGGLLAGAAVGVEYGAVFAALPIAGLLLARVRRPGGPGACLWALGGALVPVAGLALYHARVYGSAWSTGYHHVTNADFAAKHGQGFLGLGLPRWDGVHTQLLSADGGLLWWAPPVVLALYGLVQLARSRDELRAEARVHLGLVVLYGLIVSSLSFDGGWRVGPRYLVIVLPSLCMGWAHAASQLRTSILGMGGLTALATYAVVVNGLAANLWPHLDLTNVHQPVAEVLLPLWEHQRQPYGILHALVDRSGVRLVVVGSVLGTWVVLARLGDGGIRMFGTMALMAAVGLLLVQATRLVPPHPRGARNLAYIERIWEPTPDSAGHSAILRPRPPGDAEAGSGPSATGESIRWRRRPTASPRRQGARPE